MRQPKTRPLARPPAEESTPPERTTEPPAQTDEECDDPVTIAPAEEKVGEGDANLGRREEWFRKRSAD